MRSDDGHMIWVDAGDVVLLALQAVTVTTENSHVSGLVYVLPESLLVPPSDVPGVLEGSEPRAGEDELPCGTLPGAEFPPLGVEIRWLGTGRTVQAIDHQRREVLLASDDGSEERVPLASVVHD